MSAEARSAKADHALAAVVVLAATLLLASGLLLGAAPDEEEFRFTVLTSWLHVRALAGGSYAFWTPLLGFGLPQPFIANYWFHPLLPLLAVLSPDAWMRVVLLLHTALGAFGMWRLCRILDLRPVVAAICAATFLLATPSQNYLLSDFWPSPWMALTTMPWVILCAWQVLREPVACLRASALLGLLTGLVIANSNPGTVLVYAGIAAALPLVTWRASAQRWRHLALAAAIALALAAPNVALLATESEYFSADLAASSGPEPVPVSAAWDVFLRPLNRSGDSWQSDVVMRGARTLFFGGPFAVLCLIACVRVGWQRPELVLALTIAALQMFTTAAPALSVSDRLMFRDAIVLCAIPLAGLAAERGLRHRAMRSPTTVLLVAQLLIVPLAFVPFLQRAWDEQRQGAPHYRGALGQGPVADALVQATTNPGRLLYSPRVDEQVRERGLLEAGLGVNALAYRGVSVVNGWFKAVSADPISPDERSYYARIRTPPALVESGSTLDVLGIRYLLAARGERVAPDLRVRREIATPRMDLVLYENEDAGPGAFLVDPQDAGLEFPRFDGCEYDRLLCRDLSAVTGRVRDTRLSVVRRHGTIEVSMDPVATPAVLVIADMFRPEWTATSNGDALTTARFASALLAVHVPAGVSSVRLVYRPWPIILATAIAWFGVLVAVGILVRGRKSDGKG